MTASSFEQYLPRHVAVIMDGNGRWARQRNLSNSHGHKAGIEPLRTVIGSCVELGVQALTAFAFSSENWKRPDDEVNTLMNLFLESLASEIDELHEKSVQLRLIGARDKFRPELLERIHYCQQLTQDNTKLVLSIAVDYGGRWDISEASKKLARDVISGDVDPDEIDEHVLGAYISNSDLPDPDLCIRTGGEYRISNFLLWQFAYTELLVNDVLWPDYTRELFIKDLQTFVERERRFGQSG